MGPIGMLELIMLFIMLSLMVVPVVVIVIVRRFSSGGKGPQPSRLRPNVKERLEELEVLRSGNLISEAEYAEKRRSVLDSI